MLIAGAKGSRAEYCGRMRRSEPAATRARFGTAAFVAALVVVLTACSGGSSAPESDPIRAARELRDAPVIVEEGNAADTCGEFVFDHGEAVPVEAVSCLDAAMIAKEEAELAWSSLTDEGDPIVHFAYTAPGKAGIAVSVTNEFDSYAGDHGWTAGLCPDATTATSAFNDESCPRPVEG